MESIPLSENKSPIHSIINEKHSIHSLAEKVVVFLNDLLKSSSGHLYLYVGETPKLKGIFHSDNAELLPIKVPDSNQFIYNNEQSIFPINYENHLVGLIVLKQTHAELTESVLTKLQLLHAILGSKFESLVDKENLANQKRIIDEHFISIEVSGNGIITNVSEALIQELDYAADELVGHPISTIMHPQHDDLIGDKVFKEGEFLLQTKHGDHIWVDSKTLPQRNLFGEEVGNVYLQQNISKQKIVEEMANKDELTGLYNRRFFNQVFPKELDNAARNADCIAFMLIDIDNFKKYNDTYGHQEGDRVLTKVSKTLNNCYRRKGDYVFRLGGEEFGVLCNITLEADAEMLANIARKAIEDLQIEHTGNPFKVVTISTGIYTAHGENMIHDEDEVYKTADIALYEAKENGRNKVVIAGQEDDIELF